MLAVALLHSPASRADDNGCSNWTLRGDYAFTISGTIYVSNPDKTVTMVRRDGIAMTHFDGQGGLQQVDYALGNGVPQGPVDAFRQDETGHYTVNPDCTGTAEIRFPAPPGAASGAVIDLIFVLSHGGDAIHTVVTKLLSPGATAPVPASIHSDGYKLGSVPPG
jgi:hypothetical protein